MNQSDYWAIAEADIEIQNPVTDRKLRLLDDYCDVRDGLKVLDVGCGKAWVMRQWADRYDIDGTGLETNPAFLSFARELDASIVSNDRFRDRQKAFPDAARRLIRYMIVRGEVVLERRMGQRKD